MGLHRVLLTAGSNAKGQLGIGSYDDAHTFMPCQFAACEPNQLPNLTSTVSRIACGANHTVLLLKQTDDATTLWGTGDGRRGQLGPEYHRDNSDSAPWSTFHTLDGLDLSLSTGYVYKDIAAVWETTYVVLSRPGSSDVLLSMGSNDFCALGVGEGGLTETGPGVPRVVDFNHLFPDDAPRTICIRSLHAGPRHVVVQLVVTSSESPFHPQTALVGWGVSRHGQLGKNGGARFVARPTRLPVDIHQDPMVSCGLGNQHTVVLHASGRISALGSNKQGQIPLTESRERVCGLGCTWNGTYMHTTSGGGHVLLSAGNNAQGQLGRSHTTTPDEATVDLPRDRALSCFACGSEHVLVAMSGSSQEDISVLGWGWNEHGNMGLGSLGNIAVPTQLWPRENMDTYKDSRRVLGIWAGCATSWLLVE